VTTLLPAVALDLLAGEPPRALHPVVWAGRGLGWAAARAPRQPPVRARVAGAGIAVAGPLTAAAAAMALHRLPARGLRRGVETAALSATFSLRELGAAAQRVGAALDRRDLPGARSHLRDLVSRPTAGLDGAHIASAAIESVAENLVDSALAPWLAFAVAGLPGAAAYRVVNTADAMLGYRGPLRDLGWASARLDDACNLVPARLGAAALCVAAPLVGGRPGAAWRITRAQAGRTASPNAGWPMAAAAAALGVWLEKPGHYRLHPRGREPRAGDIGRALRLAAGAAALGLALATGLAAATGRERGR